jgi:hypothetical protein
MTATLTCAIFLLNVPEFEPLRRTLQSAGVAVTLHGDYHVARASGEIVLHRKDAGVGQAVWFGALTGGVIGTIVEFSEDTLRVSPLPS